MTTVPLLLLCAYAYVNLDLAYFVFFQRSVKHVSCKSDKLDKCYVKPLRVTLAPLIINPGFIYSCNGNLLDHAVRQRTPHVGNYPTLTLLVLQEDFTPQG